MPEPGNTERHGPSLCSGLTSSFFPPLTPSCTVRGHTYLHGGTAARKLEFNPQTALWLAPRPGVCPRAVPLTLGERAQGRSLCSPGHGLGYLDSGFWFSDTQHSLERGGCVLDIQTSHPWGRSQLGQDRLGSSKARTFLTGPEGHAPKKQVPDPRLPSPLSPLPSALSPLPSLWALCPILGHQNNPRLSFPPGL